MKSIYVGNLPYTTTEEDLRDLFNAHGAVQSVKVVSDRDTGKSRGFAFVEMDDAAADTAIAALNGQDFSGRRLQVNAARERTGPRRDRG